MSLIPTAQVDRRLAGEPATLTLEPTDSADESYALDAGSGTYVIYDGAGTQVTSGTASIDDDGHVLSIDLPAGTLEVLDTYAIAWSATISAAAIAWSSSLEICGGHIVSIGALRASLSELAGATVARLLFARLVAEQMFEQECAVAFVPRGARLTVGGSGLDTLVLPKVALREVISITVRTAPDATPTALTAAQLAAIDCRENGLLVLSDDVWTAGYLYDVHFAHGYDAPSADVIDAVRILAVEFAKQESSGTDQRAMSMTNELGTFRIATAGRDGATSFPMVNATIERRGRALPSVG